MSNDLISRSALLEQMHNHYEVRNPKQNATMDECCMMVIHAPAVDAETVIKSLPYVKEALEMAKQTVAPVVRCEKCVHQKKAWHEDKRMKEQGFFMYSCELNDDQFVSHVVNGNPGEFCCAGKRRVDNAD